MAPNLTLPNMAFLVERPMDLTLPLNSGTKKNNSKLSPLTQALDAKSLKGSCKNYTTMECSQHVREMSLLIGHGNEQRQRIPKKETHLVRLEKRKLAVARKWLSENVLEVKQTALAVCSLLSVYTVFCKENGEQPVTKSSFFNILQNEFVKEFAQNIDGNLQGNCLSSPKSLSVSQNQKRKLSVSDELDSSIASNEYELNLSREKQEFTLNSEAYESASFVALDQLKSSRSGRALNYFECSKKIKAISQKERNSICNDVCEVSEKHRNNVDIVSLEDGNLHKQVSNKQLAASQSSKQKHSTFHERCQKNVDDNSNQERRLVSGLKHLLVSESLKRNQEECADLERKSAKVSERRDGYEDAVSQQEASNSSMNSIENINRKRSEFSLSAHKETDVSKVHHDARDGISQPKINHFTEVRQLVSSKSQKRKKENNEDFDGRARGLKKIQEMVDAEYLCPKNRYSATKFELISHSGKRKATDFTSSEVLNCEVILHPSEKEKFSFISKEATPFKSEKDSDSNDSGCEGSESEKRRGTRTKTYHDGLLPKNEVKFSALISQSASNDKGIKGMHLEIDSGSYDSGLESLDYDSDISQPFDGSPVDGISKQYSKDNEKATQLENALSDDEEVRSLVIDEDAGEDSPIVDHDNIEKPIKIEEELFMLEEIRDVSKIEESCSNFKWQGSKSETWSASQKKVIANIITRLNLEKFLDSKCLHDASNLAKIFVQMLKNNHLNLFLKTFGHSMSCKSKHCSKLCSMFKRICKHMLSASTHKCAVKQIYGHILCLHIDTCGEDNCGISNCRILRSKRRENRASPPLSRG